MAVEGMVSGDREGDTVQYQVDGVCSAVSRWQ